MNIDLRLAGIAVSVVFALSEMQAMRVTAQSVPPRDQGTDVGSVSPDSGFRIEFYIPPETSEPEHLNVDSVADTRFVVSGVSPQEITIIEEKDESLEGACEIANVSRQDLRIVITRDEQPLLDVPIASGATERWQPPR